MLEIKDLVFEVSDEKGNITRIIDNVSITVPDGKFFVITGPNGGGKSTLARLIMGLERPTSGKILDRKSGAGHRICLPAASALQGAYGKQDAFSCGR